MHCFASGLSLQPRCAACHTICDGVWGEGGTVLADAKDCGGSSLHLRQENSRAPLSGAQADTFLYNTQVKRRFPNTKVTGNSGGLQVTPKTEHMFS